MLNIKEAIETIGMKKICLFAHYGLAIGTSILFFIVSVIATFLPSTFDITALFNIWKLIIIYCVVIVTYITIKCIFNDLQTMNQKGTKFDWIAFFIGFSMFVTLGLIIVCIIFMFKKSLTDIELQMWRTLIQVFGGMFMTEAGGGYIYNIFKKKFENKNSNEDNVLVEKTINAELSAGQA